MIHVSFYPIERERTDDIGPYFFPEFDPRLRDLAPRLS